MAGATRARVDREAGVATTTGESRSGAISAGWPSMGGEATEWSQVRRSQANIA
jgi:hypothetical protein